jgi:hypothetical protein
MKVVRKPALLKDSIIFRSLQFLNNHATMFPLDLLMCPYWVGGGIADVDTP